MTTLSIDDELVRWSAPYDPEAPLLVLMHGWGDDQDGIAGLFPHLPDGIVVAAPRAPLPTPGGPGFGWFQPAGGPGQPTEAEASAAVDAVLGWLDRIAPRGPVVVAGFSQGGAMAVQLIRTAPERFLAGASFSGFVAPYSGENDAALAAARKPMFFGCDPEDPVFPPGAPARAEAYLAAHFALDAHHYPTIGHSVSPLELTHFAAFLTPLLAAR